MARSHHGKLRTQVAYAPENRDLGPDACGRAKWERSRTTLAPMKRKPKPSYSALHTRLYRARGKATDHACSSCGEPATGWACVRNKTIRGKSNRWSVMYSLDLSDYEPLCRTCHSVLDHVTGVNHPKAKLTAAIVRDLRARVADGERIPYKRLCRELGVNTTTLNNAITGKTWRSI